MFTFPLGDGVALVPRTPAIAEEFHQVRLANHERIVRWNPGLDPRPPTPEDTRAQLARNARRWLKGTMIPVAISVGGTLTGAAALRIDQKMCTADVGYWIDAGYEGRGLVTRTVTALLDQAFGPLGLHRVTLGTSAGNRRSRALAERLGFRQEALHREALPGEGGWEDEVVYGLLVAEWAARSA
jgi:RimJ/RimL family protein N-acetyltransferase